MNFFSVPGFGLGETPRAYSNTVCGSIKKGGVGNFMVTITFWR